VGIRPEYSVAVLPMGFLSIVYGLLGSRVTIARSDPLGEDTNFLTSGLFGICQNDESVNLLDQILLVLL
jgi:hypothetical protein